MTEEEAGHQIDEALGLIPLPRKAKVAADPPQEMPARALRYFGTGTAPVLPIEEK